MKTKFTRTVAFAECDMSWQIRLCDLENYLLMAKTAAPPAPRYYSPSNS